jgi:protein-disulfide isomerase
MRFRDLAGKTVNVVLVLATLVFGYMAVVLNRRAKTDSRAVDEGPRLPELEGAGTRIGPSDAESWIVEFADFQCPYCARSVADVKGFLVGGDRSRGLIFRHFPLPSHQHAYVAAIAAECAADQGRFEEYHDLLYANPDSIGVSTWEVFALRSGVQDIQRFNKCVDNREPAPRVERDIELGKKIGVSGTPTFYFEGRRFTGQASTSLLRDLTK